MIDSKRPYRIDKSTLVVTSVTDSPSDAQFWITKTPGERLAALEFMRQVMYGYDPITARLQRVLTVTERSSR
jgi:hypothetical protein